MSPWGSAEGWLAIIGLALGTFAIRYSFIGLLAGRPMPAWFERTMRLMVLAIFAALVAPLVLLGPHAALAEGLQQRWPYLLAAVAAGFIAWKRGGTVLPLTLGMATLHLLLQAKALIDPS